MKKETILITLEEYKELLMIKGKYEELKSLYNPIFNSKKGGDFVYGTFNTSTKTFTPNV